MDASIQSVIDELARILPPTEFTPALLDDLRQAYAPGIGMADAFARWIERVLGPRGLIVYDASDRAAKPLAAGVFVRELSTAGQTARLASASGADMVARGYHAQVHAQDDSVALFRLDGARRVIRQQDGALVVGDERHTIDAMLKDASDQPGRIQSGRAAASDRAGHALPDRLLCRRAQRARVPRTTARRSTLTSACRCR